MRRVVVRVWVKQGYISGVPVSRQCSRTACSRDAVATLTYVYSDSTVVVGPLAVAAEPHSYDLCEEHASRLTAPRGWEVVRVVAPSGREVDEGAVQSRQAHPAGGSRSRDGARAVAVDAVEERRREISRPLHAPRDDWAVLADVVSSASEGGVSAATPASPQTSASLRGRGVSAGSGSVDAPGRGVAPVPYPGGRRPAWAGEPSVSPRLPVGASEPVPAPPRHAADPEPVQEGEIRRRGHLRVLRGDAGAPTPPV